MRWRRRATTPPAPRARPTASSQLSSYDAQTLASREHIEKLKADIRSLEESNRRLEAGSLERAPLGQEVSARAAAERRYITGLTLRGKRILILLDVSAS